MTRLGPASPAFSGTIAGIISSIVDTAGARSGLDATIEDLLVAGGLLPPTCSTPPAAR